MLEYRQRKGDGRMKKIISLVLGTLMLCCVNGMGKAFTSEIPNFDESPIINNSVEKVEIDKNVVEKSDLSKEQEEKINSSSETEKSEEIVSSESTKPVENKNIETKEEIVVESKSENNEQNQTQQNIVQNQEQNSVQNNVVETQVENTKKNNPWDSLGITEYEFYHKPASSWAEVNFKISDYGSYEATFNACKEYGDNYKAEHGGGYWCISVNSYSGDYLGEDIDFY